MQDKSSRPNAENTDESNNLFQPAPQ